MDAPEEATGDELVRPFIMTNGRTRARDRDLRVETLIEARGSGDGLVSERARIVGLCASPLSIAEVSAHLGLPLGVVIVLVEDLIAEGALNVHHTDLVDIELSTLQKMIERVRAI